MTSNQIAYWNLKRQTKADSEVARHNLVSEQETYRHNVSTENISLAELQESQRHNIATEVETNRHNVAGEQETARHNVAYETETNRHNVATEDLNLAALGETTRHNIATENENERTHKANEYIYGASVAETARHNQAMEQLENRAQQLKSEYQGELKRHNITAENISQYANESDRYYKSLMGQVANAKLPVEIMSMVTQMTATKNKLDAEINNLDSQTWLNKVKMFTEGSRTFENITQGMNNLVNTMSSVAKAIIAAG